MNEEKKELSPVIQSYLFETRSLAKNLEELPQNVQDNLNYLKISKDNSDLLGFQKVYKLLKALEAVYESLKEGSVVYTENIRDLVKEVSAKINECCDVIEKNDEDQPLEEVDIHRLLVYCDKAVAKEIFDIKQAVKKGTKHSILKLILEHYKKDEEINIKSSKVEELINMQEEMIARTYIIGNQIELLRNAINSNDHRAMKDTYKLLLNDSQSLQNSLRLVHEHLRTLVHDDSFLENHKEFNGFFVYANSEKYYIPSDFIFDVICANSLDYITNQNQKYVVYEKEDESGTKIEREEIPVYALSSLLPGKMVKNTNILDTILLADYQSQKIGIIVDTMQKFVSIIQKPLPTSFANFKLLQGVAFDEKYDMIPILYLPEIMRRFRSQRSYDVKKFEAYTRTHINKILIVDDSTTTREIQHSILSGNGYLVDEAFDGIDAMEKIRKKQFDLIVCDDVMPRMNGEIFLDNIRRMENYAKIPVVAISEEPIRKANAFVSKSDFTRDKLLEKISEVLHE